MEVLILTPRAALFAGDRLASSLADAGSNVTVVTRPDAASAALRNGRVRVVGVSDWPPVIPPADAPSWTLQFNAAMVARATALDLEADVIHVMGWQPTWAAASLKGLLRAPVVATLPDLRVSPTAREAAAFIHQAQWWLTFEARRVLVASDRRRIHLERAFDLPAGKVGVVRHGRRLGGRLTELYRRCIVEERQHRRPAETARPALRAQIERSLQVPAPAERPA
jgi:hypothetical protein